MMAMSKIKNMAIFGALALGLMAGCQRSENAVTDTSYTESALQDADLLVGAPPDCHELTTPARRNYRLAAFRVCQQASTVDARMKNPGCFAVQKMNHCWAHTVNGYTADVYKSEKREALQQ